MRNFKPKNPKSSEPRGYALSQNVRDRYKNFGKSRINKYRYGKNAGISTLGFSTINDYEANEDTFELAITAQPLGGDKVAPKISPELPSNGINVVSQVQQTSHPREEKPSY